MKIQELVKLSMVACAVAMIACASSSEDSASTARTIEVTEVTNNVDGTHSEKHSWLSPQQMDQLVALRHQKGQDVQPSEPAANPAPADGIGQSSAAITNDTACSNSNDILLFNAALGSGLCHPNGTFYKVICFNGSGSANLCSYTYFSGGTQYWCNNVRSYAPGTEDGYLELSSISLFVDFSANGACANTGTEGPNYDDLTLTD